MNIKILNELSVKIFEEQLKFEDVAFEWSKQFKNDMEVNPVLQSNV